MDVIFILKGHLSNITISAVHYNLVHLALYCCNMNLYFFSKGINKEIDKFLNMKANKAP